MPAKKHEANFFVRDKNTGRLHSQCKLCYTQQRTTYYAEHYLKYGDKYRQRARLRRAEIKKILQVKMMAYLQDKSCEICGEGDPRVLDFDHLTPAEKSFGVARAITTGLNWALILNEIDKCRILCANCHRKHTAMQQSWYRSVNYND